MNQFIITGLLSTGLLAAVGVGFLAYQYYQYEKEQEEKQRQRQWQYYQYEKEETRRRRQGQCIGERRSFSGSSRNTRTSGKAQSTYVGSKCLICEEGLNTEIQISLRCGHKYHKSCLQANHVLHSCENSKQPYRCPISNCGLILREDEIRSLSKKNQ